jgi:hypothetical protein
MRDSEIVDLTGCAVLHPLPFFSAAGPDQIEPGGQFAIGAASGNEGSVRPKIMQIATTQIKKPTVMTAASCRSARRLAWHDSRARLTPSPNASK